MILDNYEKLLKLMEYVDIEEGEDGLYIDIKKNIHVQNHGHFINKIKGNFVLVTDSNNKGMIYLNPNSVSFDDNQTITEVCINSYESFIHNERRLKENESEQNKNCSDCNS